MNVQRLIETYNTYEEPQDWAEQAKEALGQLQNALEQETTMLCQQQAKIEALKQVLQSIANEHVELSHDKIKWQCDDHIRWAKEALK